MSNQNAELTARSSRWQGSYLRTMLETLCLLGLGAITALAKKFSPDLGIPGSSAILWLTPLVAGRALIRKDGAGVVIGTSTALWGVPLGLNHTLMYNLGLYGVTGLALDIILKLPFLSIRNPIGAIFCGAVAHMAKFGFLLGTVFFASTTKHFVIVGIARSASLHLAFGAAAGLVGWIAFKAWPSGQHGS